MKEGLQQNLWVKQGPEEASARLREERTEGKPGQWHFSNGLPAHERLVSLEGIGLGVRRRSCGHQKTQGLAPCDAQPSCESSMSHVEPDREGYWWADMEPVEGPVLGPFKNRTEALGAERGWLLERRKRVVRTPTRVTILRFLASL